MIQSAILKPLRVVIALLFILSAVLLFSGLASLLPGQVVRYVTWLQFIPSLLKFTGVVSFSPCRLYHCYHLNPSVWPGLLFVHLSAWDFAGSLYQVISLPPETNKYLQAAIIYHFPFCFGDLYSPIVLSEHIFFKSAGSLRIKREDLCGTERHTGPFPLPVVVFHASQYVEKPMVL